MLIEVVMRSPAIQVSHDPKTVRLMTVDGEGPGLRSLYLLLDEVELFETAVSDRHRVQAEFRVFLSPSQFRGHSNLLSSHPPCPPTYLASSPERLDPY